MHYTVIYLLSKKLVCENTLLYEFAVNPGEYCFKAGQYANFKIPYDNYKDEKGNSRIFSFANSPLNAGKIEISARLKNSKFAHYLNTLNDGTPILLSEAKGTLHKIFEKKEKVVVIAGGIGITPVRSIVNDIFLRNENKRITLFYSNKSHSQSAFIEEFEFYEKTIPDFNFVPVFEEGNSFMEKLERGKVNFDLILKHEKIFDGKRFLLLGSPKFVSYSELMLLQNGILPEQIYKDM